MKLWRSLQWMLGRVSTVPLGNILQGAGGEEGLRCSETVGAHAFSRFSGEYQHWGDLECCVVTVTSYGPRLDGRTNQNRTKKQRLTVTKGNKGPTKASGHISPVYKSFSQFHHPALSPVCVSLSSLFTWGLTSTHPVGSNHSPKKNGPVEVAQLKIHLREEVLPCFSSSLWCGVSVFALSWLIRCIFTTSGSAATRLHPSLPPLLFFQGTSHGRPSSSTVTAP